MAARLEIWLPHHVADRLREASDTLHRKPMERHSMPDSIRSAMPEPRVGFWEMFNQLTIAEMEERQREINRTKIQPTSAQISEMWEALGWVLFMLDDPRSTQICMGVARGHSWRRVAQFDGRDPKTIKAIWLRSCEQIADRLGVKPR